MLPAMRRFLLVALLAVSACSGVSQECVDAAAKWNATISPTANEGAEPGEVLTPPEVDDTQRFAIPRRLELTETFPECFSDEMVEIAEAQAAEAG